MSINLREVFHEALPIIENVAPSIASVIGGAPGVAAGVLLPLLAKAFNTNPGDFRGLVNNITTDPDAEKKLVDVVMQHASWASSIASDVKFPSHVEITLKMDFNSPNNS